MIPDFEKTFAHLESIVKQMETESLDLETSIKAFEEGMALSLQCQKILAAAQQRVDIILQTASPSTTAVSTPDENR